MTDLQPAVLDLFAGCGGMSWGLHLDGFRVIGAIDEWRDALATFEHNHPDAEILECDIRDLEVEDVLSRLGLKRGELDVLVGGPPCQGFSKNVPATYRFLEDPRNQLFRDYLRFVEEAEPRVVVMENVAELFNAYGGEVREEVTTQLARMGYASAVQVVTAADYGVPQKRRRCVFIATNTGLEPKFPDPTHRRDACEGDDALFAPFSPWVSAWDSISDLPDLCSGEGASPSPHVAEPTNDYQRWVHHGARLLHNHEAVQLRPTQQARYESLGPGEGYKQLPPHLKPKSGYSGAYGRLDFENVAPTITRWVFHPGSGRYGHPRRPRIITMREAARLQSFTDDFTFVGSRNSIAGQIGNAVPPRLMLALAPEIRRLLAG